MRVRMKLVLVKTPRTGKFVSVTPDTHAPTYGDEYPESTDVLCWHCCHSFEGRPIPLPLSYNQHLDAYRVYGTFCSFRCMLGYLGDYRQSIPGASNGSIGMTVFDFYRKCTGDSNPAHLQRAPPRCMLKAFGGHMSLEDFRSHTESTFTKVPSRCILHEQVYHERLHSQSHRHIRSMAGSIQPSSSTQSGGETLRLKRKYQNTDPPKPSTKKTILEQTLGIA